MVRLRTGVGTQGRTNNTIAFVVKLQHHFDWLHLRRKVRPASYRHYEKPVMLLVPHHSRIPINFRKPQINNPAHAVLERLAHGRSRRIAVSYAYIVNSRVGLYQQMIGRIVSPENAVEFSSGEAAVGSMEDVGA